MKILVELKYDRAAAAIVGGKKVWNDLMRRAWERVGAEWFVAYLPRHFTTEGGRMYRYENRTKRYMLRKSKTKHHQTPLVWSGDLKARTLAYPSIYPSRSGVRVALPGARKANLRQKNGINLARELVAIAPSEVASLADVHSKTMDRLLSSYPGTKTVRIGS